MLTGCATILPVAQCTAMGRNRRLILLISLVVLCLEQGASDIFIDYGEVSEIDSTTGSLDDEASREKLIYQIDGTRPPFIVDFLSHSELETHETSAPFLGRILSDSTDVTEPVGETVTLPCNADLPGDIVHVLWKKGTEEVIFENDVRHLDDSRFNLVNGTSLQISSILPTDTGTYFCQISEPSKEKLYHTLTVTSQQSTSTPCPNRSAKWIYLGGDYCYVIEKDESFTWIEAVYKCFEEGGSLATFQSYEEIKRIQRYTKTRRGRVHIGLWKTVDGTLQWVDKSTSLFRNWDRGEPNDRDERCVELFTENGRWNDIPCYLDLGYICSSPKVQPPPAVQKSCPPSSSRWNDYGGEYCYIIEFYNETTWDDASELCAAEGGSLASFHSIEELAIVREKLRTHYDRMHIGLRRNSDETFEWEDRSPMDLEFWDSDEPNDITERCGEIYPGSGYWNDIPCSKIEGYICSAPKVYPEDLNAKPTQPPQPEICGEDIFAESGTIQSPNYPKNYGPNTNCLWKITVPEYHQVLLHFQEIQLEYGANCEFDYLEVLDGFEESSAVLTRLCGSDAKRTVLSSGNKIAIKFASDEVTHNSGFLAEFSKVEQCGGNIVSEEGIIRSQNYPNNYRANDKCVWKITVPEGSGILLSFESFEVEESFNCDYDYLEIFDGHDEFNRVLGKYCGSSLPSETSSSGHKMTIKFTSDSTKEYYGFSAKFTKVEAPLLSDVLPATSLVAVCGDVIEAEQGILVSPNYPEEYSPYSYCLQTIKGPSGSRIKLRFKTFELESSSSCDYDYVEIYDGPHQHSPTLGKFCGSIAPSPIRSSGNEMSVLLKTDGSAQFRGFTAIFETEGAAVSEPGQAGACSERFTSDEGVIKSPNYPSNYGANEECVWTITVPSHYNVVLKFDEFKVEMHHGCIYDSVFVHDGNTTATRVLARLCGSDIPNEIRSSGNAMTIHFVSDSSGEYSGFSAEFRKDNSTGLSEKFGACEEEILADNGTISSPNYPNFYGPLEECIYKIAVPERHVVFLEFQNVDLEFSGDCNLDYITVLDGSDTDSPVLAVLCQNTSEPIQSSSNQMTVKFVSDDSFESPGFSANFRKVFSCGGDIVSESGFLEIPDDALGGEFRCRWTITVPSNNFVLLHLHNSDGVIIDVSDGEYAGLSATVPDESGGIRFYRTKSNKMIVTVEPESQGIAPQFYAEFRKDMCGGEIVADSGVITSPKYPEFYAPNENCVWEITVPENHSVLLSFEKFDLEDGCNYDSVEILDGSSTSSIVLGRFCGLILPEDVISESNKMTVRFSTDGSVQKRGFSAKFTFTEQLVNESCNRDITTEKGKISSPNYPRNYKPDSNCAWKITVPESNIVVLRFKSFNIEGNEECRYDAVTVRDGHEDSPMLGKFCGSDIPDPVLSSTNKMYVTFTSDSSDQRRGFEAEFQSEPASYPDIENLIRQFPEIINLQKKPKSRPSSGRKPRTKRSLLETLTNAYKLV